MSKPQTKPAPDTGSIRQSSELTALIEEYKDLFDFANEDLEHTDPRTRPGKQIRKMEAQEKLAAVKVRYVAALKKGLAAIFLDGKAEDVAFFAKVAEDEGPAIVVSASAATRGQHRARNISRTQDIATYPHAQQALS